jgi:VIT1/CCC1 family predicted Fe2+/Mn2+ transporter
MDKKTFQEHLKNEHQSSPFSTYLQEFVYGGTDGIVTTFAVVAGFSGASLGDHALNLSIITVLMFGLANLFADGAAMGLGNFLSIRSQKHLYKRTYYKELQQIEQSREFELEETTFIFEEKGYSKNDASQLAELLAKNPDFWAKFMVEHECGVGNPEGSSALYNGIATFSSFLFFGFIPLLPYFYMNDVEQAFIQAIGFAVLALVLLGMFRVWVTKERLWISVLETLAVGSTAASLAYLVGYLFK